jgi:hypothetical protein
MSGRKALAALAVATTLAALTAVPAAATDRDDHGIERGGAVVRCSLDGVNPAYHPQIFGNPAFARAYYGFVLGRDHVWRVEANCHIY